MALILYTPSLPGVDQKWGRLIWIYNYAADMYAYNIIPSVEMKLRPKQCNTNEASCSFLIDFCIAKLFP